MSTATLVKTKAKWPMKRVRWKSKHLWVPIIDKPYTRILEFFKQENHEFDMSCWIEHPNFTCKTVCCIGGSVMLLAGRQGKDLDRAMMPCGLYDPALLILEHSSTLPVPAFNADEYDTKSDEEANRKALAELRRLSRLEKAL